MDGFHKGVESCETRRSLQMGAKWISSSSMKAFHGHGANSHHHDNHGFPCWARF